MVANNVKIGFYPCIPESWLWMPKYCRIFLGWTYATVFSASFLAIPMALLLLIPQVWTYAPKCALCFLSSLLISLLIPAKEWPLFRKLGQLMFEVFSMECNLSPSDREKLIQNGDKIQYVFCMHPHGIIPIQSILFSAYEDIYFVDEKSGRNLYGFGAGADIILYIPYLRNIVVSSI
jgi:hypothetical protein